MGIAPDKALFFFVWVFFSTEKYWYFFLFCSQKYIILSEALLMNTHNICFCGEIHCVRKMSCGYYSYLELCMGLLYLQEVGEEGLLVFLLSHLLCCLIFLYYTVSSHLLSPLSLFSLFWGRQHKMIHKGWPVRGLTRILKIGVSKPFSSKSRSPHNAICRIYLKNRSPDHQNRSPGPSCSKRGQLNELISGQIVICSSKYKI